MTSAHRVEVDEHGAEVVHGDVEDSAVSCSRLAEGFADGSEGDSGLEVGHAHAAGLALGDLPVEKVVFGVGWGVNHGDLGGACHARRCIGDGVEAGVGEGERVLGGVGYKGSGVHLAEIGDQQA